MAEWDRTHDWVLEQFFHDRTRVGIRFNGSPPRVTELAAVRRCVAVLRDIPPAEVRGRIDATGLLSLGVMGSAEARQLIQNAEAHGLNVIAETASFISYLPFDRTTGCAWLIEDEEESLTIAREMMAAGVPVRRVEA